MYFKKNRSELSIEVIDYRKIITEKNKSSIGKSRKKSFVI